MTEVEGLSLGDAAEWCGETITVRTRLRRLAPTDSSAAGEDGGAAAGQETGATAESGGAGAGSAA